MCHHKELVLASRNAVVGVMEVFGPSEPTLAKTVVAYDILLNEMELECRSCTADALWEIAGHEEPRESDYLRFISEWVERYLLSVA